MLRRTLLAASMTGFLCGPALAGNLLFILDSSGSMWGKLDGQAKIQTAKTSLSTLIGDLPKDTKVGLMVYGHRYDRKAPDACKDIELISPVGQTTPNKVEGWLKRIVPKGKTPIAATLQQTADAFVGLEKGNNNVVLISDGIETCDGDPCAVAGKLAKSNINVRVHVVGFDISQKDREQLECIAKLGKGKYFPADSTAGFNKAISEAVKVAQVKPTPAPPPSPPPAAVSKRERVFFDDFEADKLAPHWMVGNANPDEYLVEDGKLLLFSGQTTGFHKEKMPNLITLKNKLPGGDWDAIIKFTGEFKTGRDQFWFGLRKDHGNFLSADLSWYFRPGSTNDYITLRLLKHAKGTPSETPAAIYASNAGDAAWEKFIAPFEVSPSTITLSKRGRNYFASFANTGMKDKDGKQKIWKTDKLTSLRVPGQLTIGVSKWADTKGEVLTFIDSVELVRVQE